MLPHPGVGGVCLREREPDVRPVQGCGAGWRLEQPVLSAGTGSCPPAPPRTPPVRAASSKTPEVSFPPPQASVSLSHNGGIGVPSVAGMCPSQVRGHARPTVPTEAAPPTLPAPQARSLARGLPSPSLLPSSAETLPKCQGLQPIPAPPTRENAGEQARPLGHQNPSAQGPGRSPEGQRPAQDPQTARLIKASDKNRLKGSVFTRPPLPPQRNMRGSSSEAFAPQIACSGCTEALLRSPNLQPTPSPSALCAEDKRPLGEGEPSAQGHPARSPCRPGPPPPPPSPHGEGLLQRCLASGRTHPAPESKPPRASTYDSTCKYRDYKDAARVSLQTVSEPVGR